MNIDFTGRGNNLVPNTIILDEAENKWRILLGGVLKIDRYDSMDEACEAVNRFTARSTDTKVDTVLKAIIAANRVLEDLRRAMTAIGFSGSAARVDMFNSELSDAYRTIRFDKTLV